MTSSSYRSFRYLSQSFLRFSTDFTDLGVCPVTYRRNKYFSFALLLPLLPAFSPDKVIQISISRKFSPTSTRSTSDKSPIIFLIGAGNFRTSVGIARIWSFRASCGVFTKSITSRRYRPSRCSPQIFFRFASAASDFGVCPATYSRNSSIRPFLPPFDFFGVASALAFMLIPHSSVSSRGRTPPRASAKTHHLHRVLGRLELPLLFLPRQQRYPRFFLRELRPHRRNLRLQCFPFAFQNAPLLLRGLLSPQFLRPVSRLLR